MFVGSGDNETAIQEECGQCVNDIIIQNLRPTELAFQCYLWPQFTNFPRAAEKCLRENFFYLSKKQAISTDAVKYLQNFVVNSDDTLAQDAVGGAWVLLSCVAPYCPGPLKVDVILDCWKRLLKRKEFTDLC